MSAYSFSEFLLEVAKGNVPGHSSIHISGHNENVGATFEDVWAQGGDYTDSTVAVVHYISSSSAADTMEFKVDYLDSDWMPQTLTVTLAGQTKTQIGTGETMIRVQSVSNDSGTAIAGDVYVYENDTVTAGIPDTATLVRAKVEILHNKSVIAKFAVPADKTAFHLDTMVSTAVAKDTETLLMVRQFGKTYLVHEHINIISNYIPNMTSAHISVLPKSDIKYRAKAAGAGGSVNASFGLLLVDTVLIGSEG